ncbi:hypothetical protein [Mycobacterium sp. PSTR-4-N]|uniref:hypothetical protein n=1 Tax=Mycobacterium sp. PSTR-4-N TaxID=2917745 RepID=UPI001F14A30B|nr:hypothetical protein [Mycobacterium sp. PSTR-4-N]MCG7592425.1 hypothetical protein [Mycobacterium sp. PSTR-4-N]
MSLYVKLALNGDGIGDIAITRVTDVGSEPDSVNTYRWLYDRGDDSARGLVTHRFGDGAVVLASKVLAEIALRHQIANQAHHAPKVTTDDQKIATRAKRGHFA